MDLWNEKGDMDCKTFEKLIPEFIAERMDYPSLKRFLAHREKCDACREELEIRFLVSEGIHRLEDGNAFDLQAELERHLLDSKKKIRFNDGFMSVGLGLEIIAVCLLAGGLVWILL